MRVFHAPKHHPTRVLLLFFVSEGPTSGCLFMSQPARRGAAAPVSGEPVEPLEYSLKLADVVGAPLSMMAPSSLAEGGSTSLRRQAPLVAWLPSYGSARSGTAPGPRLLLSRLIMVYLSETNAPLCCLSLSSLFSISGKKKKHLISSSERLRSCCRSE